MFCSKCGHEINDKAVFCDKCGFRIKGDDAQCKGITDIPENERNSKIRACIAYLIENAVVIGILISLISSKFGTIVSFIDSSYYSSERMQEFFQAFYEENFELWSWVVLMLVIGSFIFNFVKLYFLPLKNRSFRTNMANIHKTAPIGVIVFLVYAVLAFVMAAQSVEFEIKIGLYILGVLIIALHWVSAILYRSAALSEPDTEQIAFDKKLKEDGKWQCGKCGSFNPETVQSCRDCGAYK